MLKKIISLIVMTLFATSVYANESKDTYFEAEEVIYNKNTGVFTSIGYTDIEYDKAKLKTKTLEFDTNKNEIVAKGSINVSNPGGIMNTENLIIKKKKKNATIGKTNVSILL